MPIHCPRATSSQDSIVRTTTMTVQIQIPMEMDSSNLFGIKEFRAKGFCSRSSMMSTMTMTASPMARTGTTTTMVHLTSIKSSSVSGVKNNPLGIMTTTVFSTGQTMIGTAMAGPTKLRTQVSTHSLLHGTMTTTVYVTTSMKTMTQTACTMRMKSCSGLLALDEIRPTHGITTTLETARESLIQTIPTPVQTLSI